MTATRLGVIGWPVDHSRSPQMFAAAFAACGLKDWHYQRLPLTEAVFEPAVRALGPAGFRGANVTIPHKAAALACADTATDAAREIGAANTLSFAADGSIAAANTDAPGFLEAVGRPVKGLGAMVLGAGGSARAVVWALTRAGAADVAICARTQSRAQEVARALGARAVRSPLPADLLVNCTPVGLGRPENSSENSHILEQLGLDVDALSGYPHVVDLVYSEGTTTPLVSLAREVGAAAVDGRELLVAQGALSFELWTGLDAPRDAMRAAIA